MSAGARGDIPQTNKFPGDFPLPCPRRRHRFCITASVTPSRETDTEGRLGPYIKSFPKHPSYVFCLRRETSSSVSIHSATRYARAAESSTVAERRISRVEQECLLASPLPDG